MLLEMLVTTYLPAASTMNTPKFWKKISSDIKVSFNHVTLLNPDKDNSCIVFKALLKYVSNTGIKV